MKGSRVKRGQENKKSGATLGAWDKKKKKEGFLVIVQNKMVTSSADLERGGGKKLEK